MRTDYVVVGGGSAGAVVAARLSEDPSVTVTLIEAGGPPKGQEVNIPVAFSKLFKGPLDWDLSTEPQPHLDGRRLYWPRGKALGGSSNINAQMWVRGHRADYDGWADAGCTGWGYDDVLPYFRRAECRRPADGDGCHGTTGPLHIQDQRDPNPATAVFLDACRELGLERRRHHNEGDNEGYAPTLVTQRNGRRWSTYDAYLKPAMKRPNLTVLTHTLVDRVELDGHRAVAVHGQHEGRPVEVRAAREIILAGGTVSSPLVLQRSGIGDPDLLARHGIDVVTASPAVGAHLRDHLMVAVIHGWSEPVTLVDAEKPIQLLRYLVRRTGLLTSNIGEAAAFVRSAPDVGAPDLELLFGPVPYIDHGLVDEVPGHGVTAGPILLQPRSSGTVCITSADPTASPSIDPQYLTDPDDRVGMIAGIREALRLFDTAAMAPHLTGPIEVPASGSDDDITRFLAAQAETLYHPVGTCRMGADATSVVDPELRVRGVTGLRVADASVMPTPNRGHTHAPAVMIGERAADLVRASAARG